MRFPFYNQTDTMSCGATCLRMIAKHYGKSISLADLIQLTSTKREGTSLLGISYAAEKIGLRSLGIKIQLSQLTEEIDLPIIAHWNQNHFIVVYKIRNDSVYVADPAHGLIVYTRAEFAKSWISHGREDGVVLLLETTPEFYTEDSEPSSVTKKNSSKFLVSYLLKHKKAITQLLIGLLAGSLLQLIFPFLTQSIVDIGIQTKDIHFIYLILIAQLMVFFGKTSIDIIRNYILMHVSSRINISLVSDFFAKLMRLPINYFDSKMTGDIMQRISDNSRIESFLTGSSLNTLFSTFNFVVFSGVLAFYSLKIFTVFIIGSIIYFIWITFFLKKRAELDYKRFQQGSQNQSKIIELISGMQEIKLNNAEQQKRWQWERIQALLFKTNLVSLTLTTIQNSGSSLINELKNIFITFLAAKLVLDGQVTIGMMLSISYITGQLNAPVIEMVNFIQNWQDARLSFERLSEIHNRPDEEVIKYDQIEKVDSNMSFNLKNLCFKYDGVGNDLVLKDINVIIPNNKVTAIVGASGSGKTTLMKLLLKFYEPNSGEIKLDDLNLKNIQVSLWRKKCGVVMQEGFIFSDTIANNIAVGVEEINKEQLKYAASIANISDFIENLPLGYNTKIGMEGIGLSTGQKQRILIARSVYKNPDYLFFDEATSALDSNNEKAIMENLNKFYIGRTVIVIAHRLSTVKNADQIIVLNKGEIVEVGNHIELTSKRGFYFELVKNQLELGT